MTITIFDQTLFNKLTYSQNGRVTRAQAEAYSSDLADMFSYLDYWWAYHWVNNPAQFGNGETIPYTMNGSSVGGSSHVITGLSSTANMCPTMKVWSASLGVYGDIGTVDSASQITLDIYAAFPATAFSNQPLTFYDPGVTLRAYYDPMFYMPAIHLTMGGVTEAQALQGIAQGRVWRNDYLAGGSGAQVFNFMCRGQALCYAITGESGFKDVIRQQADLMLGPHNPQQVGLAGGSWYEQMCGVVAFPAVYTDQKFELREMHRLGEVLMYAHLLGCTSVYGHNFLALHNSWLNYALARQRPDGSFRDASNMKYLGGDQYSASSYDTDSHTGWGIRGFYMAMYCFTLCESYIMINPDARIVTAVEACMNYFWNDPDGYILYKADAGFADSPPPVYPGSAAEHGTAYISWTGGHPGSGIEGRSPADTVSNTLNGYFLLSHAFLWQRTGNPIWKTRYLKLARGQRWAYFWGTTRGVSKQMNQQFAYWPLTIPMVMGAAAGGSAAGRPDGTISTGLWRNELGGTVLNTSLDEGTADNADYIASGENVTNDVCEVSLSDPAAGIVNGPIKYRYGKKRNNSVVVNLRVRLMQGTTEIAAWNHTDIPFAPADATQFLTGPQFAAITTPTDLRLQFITNPS